MNLNSAGILICDDSILARKQLKNIIMLVGNPTFYEAENGEMAVEVYKDKKPELVFLGIVMPKINGIEALKQMREIYHDGRVVMVSSVGT